MTKQSYQIIICKKSLYLSSPEPEPFFNENYGSGSSKIWRLHGSRLRLRNTANNYNQPPHMYILARWSRGMILA